MHKLESAFPILVALAEAARPIGPDAEFLKAERPLAIQDATEALSALKTLVALLKDDEQPALETEFELRRSGQ